MNINWRVQLKNKTFWMGAAGIVVPFIYSLLALFDVVPSISESNLIEFLTMGISILGAIGVVNDPTTAGITDSEQAMGYDKPKDDSNEED